MILPVSGRPTIRRTVFACRDIWGRTRRSGSLLIAGVAGLRRRVLGQPAAAPGPPGRTARQAGERTSAASTRSAATGRRRRSATTSTPTCTCCSPWRRVPLPVGGGLRPAGLRPGHGRRNGDLRRRCWRSASSTPGASASSAGPDARRRVGGRRGAVRRGRGGRRRAGGRRGSTATMSSTWRVAPHLVRPEHPGAEPGGDRRRGQRALEPVVERHVEGLADEVLVGQRHQHRPAGRRPARRAGG